MRMTIPVLFDFAEGAIILLSVTALVLAFYYMYATEAKKAEK
ncbi:MAG: hypothetical protein NWF07_10200 [Candidatus Bathyarchaeota archaeon]|nr:hypothetical protein [Candidatus Bathyarchaeota archaeon]